MSTSGDIMSTSGMFSTLEGYHEHIGGYHEYIEGCLVDQRDTMMHVGGYQGYIGGCSVHWSFQYKSKAFIHLLPHVNHDILPMYS